MNESMCIVDFKGRILEISQENREPNDGEFKVPIEGYYKVLNEQRFDSAVWDFKQKEWVGVGEQRSEPVQEPSEVEVLKKQVNVLENQIALQEELIFEMALKVYE